MNKWGALMFYRIFIQSCFGPSQAYPSSHQIAFVSSRNGNFEIYIDASHKEHKISQNSLELIHDSLNKSG